MLKQNLIYLVFAAAVLTLSGCQTTANVNDFLNQAIPSGLTADEIADGIIVAGIKRGWKIHKEADGHLIGELNIRSHYAAVDINYTLTDYSITYRDSKKLNYSGPNSSKQSSSSDNEGNNDPASYFIAMENNSKEQNKVKDNNTKVASAKIHKQYNNWVLYLNGEIQQVVFLTAMAKKQ